MKSVNNTPERLIEMIRKNHRTSEAYCTAENYKTRQILITGYFL